MIPIDSLLKSGVYVVRKNNKPIYVGSTKNLATRIGQHEFSKDPDVKIDVEIIDDMKVARRREVDLIKVLQPELNVTHNPNRQKVAKKRGQLNISVSEQLLEKLHNKKEEYGCTISGQVELALEFWWESGHPHPSLKKR